MLLRYPLNNTIQKNCITPNQASCVFRENLLQKLVASGVVLASRVLPNLEIWRHATRNVPENCCLSKIWLKGRMVESRDLEGRF